MAELLHGLIAKLLYGHMVVIFDSELVCTKVVECIEGEKPYFHFDQGLALRKNGLEKAKPSRKLSFGS